MLQGLKSNDYFLYSFTITKPLLEVDKDDIIQLANQSFCDMSGFSLIDLLGNKASDILLHPEDKKKLLLKIKSASRGNQIRMK